MTEWHKREIPRGNYGEISKIREEVEEALDSDEQGIKIMTLLELSDIVGAVEGVLINHFPDFSLDDLVKFARLRGQVSVTHGWASK